MELGVFSLSDINPDSGDNAERRIDNIVDYGNLAERHLLISMSRKLTRRRGNGCFSVVSDTFPRKSTTVAAGISSGPI